MLFHGLMLMSLFSLFLITSLANILSPGMGVIFAIVLSLQQGWRKTAFFALGQAIGIAILFTAAMSGMGVTIANNSSTMQQTMFVMFFFVMIFILMSGLLTPVESMPAWAQRITWFLPPRYFLGIMRAVYLKGASDADLRPDYAALALFAALFNLWAALSYRKRS